MQHINTIPIHVSLLTTLQVGLLSFFFNFFVAIIPFVRFASRLSNVHLPYFPQNHIYNTLQCCCWIQCIGNPDPSISHQQIFSEPVFCTAATKTLCLETFCNGTVQKNCDTWADFEQDSKREQ